MDCLNFACCIADTPVTSAQKQCKYINKLNAALEMYIQLSNITPGIKILCSGHHSSVRLQEVNRLTLFIFIYVLCLLSLNYRVFSYFFTIIS
jgi:hypothetical protein